MTAKRVLAGIFLWGGIFFLPWFAIFFSGVVSFFIFELYWEWLLVAFLIDLLYGLELPKFNDFQFVLSAVSLAAFILLTQVKKRMRL